MGRLSICDTFRVHTFAAPTLHSVYFSLTVWIHSRIPLGHLTIHSFAQEDINTRWHLVKWLVQLLADGYSFFLTNLQWFRIIKNAYNLSCEPWRVCNDSLFICRRPKQNEILNIQCPSEIAPEISMRIQMSEPRGKWVHIDLVLDEVTLLVSFSNSKKPDYPRANIVLDCLSIPISLARCPTLHCVASF